MALVSVKVTGRFGITVIDGSDPGDDPDVIYADEGQVRLVPLITYTKYATDSPAPSMLGQSVIDGTIDDQGYLSWNGQRFVKVVDLTQEALNPHISEGKATHRVEFRNIKVGGTAVNFETQTIRIATDTVDPVTGVCDLVLLAPVPTGQGTPIVVGPRGTGLTGAVVQPTPTTMALELTDGSLTSPIDLPAGPGGSDEGVAGYLADDDSDTTAATVERVATAVADPSDPLGVAAKNARDITGDPATTKNPQQAVDGRVAAQAEKAAHKALGYIVVTDPDYGAVGDAVPLTDATMTNGSKTCTSPSGGFKAGMVGKVILVAGAGGGGAPLKTTVESFQSANEVTLAVAASAAATISGGPNINAIVGTDNTAAFQAAYTAAAAIALAAGTNLARYQRVPRIHVPDASFLVTGQIAPFAVGGLSLRGADKYASRIFYTGAGPMLSLDTFNASPATSYDGKASHFTVENVTITSGIYLPDAWIGVRPGIAIQDNGSGDLVVRDAIISGFKYGTYATSGSDFSKFTDSYYRRNDVGVYLGPGSQQVSIHSVDFFGNGEGVVNEGAPQGEFVGCSWENNKISDVTFDGTKTLTRAGLPYNVSGAVYAGGWGFYGCWFETGAGESTSTNNPQNIWIKSTGSDFGWLGIGFRDCYLVAGGSAQTPGGTVAFINDVGTSAANPVIDNLTIRGSRINTIHRYAGAGTTSAPVIRNSPIPSSPNGITNTLGPAGSRRVTSGSTEISQGFIWEPAFDGAGHSILMFGSGRQSGTTPLWKVRAGNTSTTISGVAQGGALLNAHMANTLAAAGAVAIDASQANTWITTLNANATSSSIANPTIAGQRLAIAIKQGGAGGFTFTWPANCRFAGGAAPTLSTTAGYTDVVTFTYDGTNWLETSRSLAVR